MDASLQSKINDLSTHGYHFDSGRYISMAWSNFLKASGMYIGYAILLTVIMMVLSFIPFASLISPILTIGIAIVASKIQRGEHFEFGDFFGGFKHNPGHLLLVGLISGLLMIVMMLPIMVLGIFASDNEAVMALIIFVAIIPVIYFAIAWSWANYFVAFKGLDFWPAMEASRKIISKQWFSFFGFSILLGLIGFAGLLCFGVGLFVAMPLISIASFVAFEQIVGLNEENEIDLIDHLIDDEF